MQRIRLTRRASLISPLVKQHRHALWARIALAIVATKQNHYRIQAERSAASARRHVAGKILKIASQDSTVSTVDPRRRCSAFTPLSKALKRDR